MDERSFTAALDAAARLTDARLAELLDETPEAGERARPSRLLAAMRHAVLAGGKRLRPFLAIEAARLFGVADRGPVEAGAAIELLHAYSLVHDDLPSMDDDELRRGQPTVHVAFDEATAILAGDALQTLAFDAIARPSVDADPAVRLALAAGLARASGLGGMAGGQMLDLAAEGRFEPAGRPPALGVEAILDLQAMKTGALIAFAIDAGAILGRAGEADRAALRRYGEALGRAFQIADDLLDKEGDAATVGKATGKDEAAGKATLVGLLGLEGARARLAEEVAAAEAALEGFGDRAATLAAAARYVAARRK